jgi:hypothetical protein
MYEFRHHLENGCVGHAHAKRIVILQRFSNFFLLNTFFDADGAQKARTGYSKCGGIIMRKLFHTTAALSALLATSMAANAADVRARPAPYAPPPPVYVPPPFSWTGFLSRRQHWGSLGSS